MAQQPSLAELLHLKTHKAFMRFNAMTEDDHVCEDEQEEILDTFDELTMLADLVHRTQQAGITMMRRGPESARLERQVRSIEADHGPLGPEAA